MGQEDGSGGGGLSPFLLEPELFCSTLSNMLEYSISAENAHVCAPACDCTRFCTKQEKK